VCHVSAVSRGFSLGTRFPPAWAPAFSYHGRSGYEPFPLVLNPDGVVVSTANDNKSLILRMRESNSANYSTSVNMLCYILTQRENSGPAHTRTEGRAPGCCSEFTTKAAEIQGGSEKNRARHFCSGPWPSCCPSPRFGSRGFPGRRARRAATRTAFITPGSRSKSDARGALLPPKALW
jgi:hypothetical protein